jgi:hypothetical protein
MICTFDSNLETTSERVHITFDEVHISETNTRLSNDDHQQCCVLKISQIPAFQGSFRFQCWSASH